MTVRGQTQGKTGDSTLKITEAKRAGRLKW
jgi:hypothetical protein